MTLNFVFFAYTEEQNKLERFSRINLLSQICASKARGLMLVRQGTVSSISGGSLKYYTTQLQTL
jgi:hypothetical protein